MGGSHETNTTGGGNTGGTCEERALQPTVEAGTPLTVTLTVGHAGECHSEVDPVKGCGNLGTGVGMGPAGEGVTPITSCKSVPVIVSPSFAAG